MSHTHHTVRGERRRERKRDRQTDRQTENIHVREDKERCV